MNDLKISENKLKAFKVYRCLNCKIIQNNSGSTPLDQLNSNSY